MNFSESYKKLKFELLALSLIAMINVQKRPQLNA